MGRVQMSTEEKPAAEPGIEKRNWWKKALKTTKSHSRPAVSRMSASILLLAGLLFTDYRMQPPQRPLGPSARQDPEIANTGGLFIRGTLDGR